MPRTYVPLINTARRLEPEGRILHGAGQSQQAFAAYAQRFEPTPPRMIMTCLGLRNPVAPWFERLHANIAP